MVSFTCNHCQDVVKKPKVPNHANTCGSHSFTCVDCMQVFDLDTIKNHTSCVTEEDKYQGKWKQKLSTNNNGSSGEAPRGIERPPRAPMNDLSSSEDSDEDWVKKGSAKVKKAEHKKAASSTPTAAPVTTAPARRKNPRPGVSPSSDDEDEGYAKLAKPPAKRAKTAGSPSATPTTKPVSAAAPPRSPPSSSLGPKMSKAPVQGAKHTATHMQKGGEDADEGEEASRPYKKDTPLLLPRSTTSTECMVPSFVLGTSQELADIVRDVLAENGTAAMRSKDLAVALVDRYAKRIAKSVRHAVDTAVELGALKLDKKGNVALAQMDA